MNRKNLLGSLVQEFRTEKYEAGGASPSLEIQWEGGSEARKHETLEWG
jgi:hypothetical protein